ncbi:hypothetical protein ACFWDQ_23715 [Streptomyces sp. NPDC060053]|uniref:hypothetical protein n=1 Tax=Streptomyces sp. NPDC060053 TaxID=3347047 RepID=UPI00368532D0
MVDRCIPRSRTARHQAPAARSSTPVSSSSGLLTLTALGSSVSDGYKATITVGVDSA